MTDIKIVVTNKFDQPMDLVLEPWGEIYRLDPDQQRTVIYQGDQPDLAVDLSPGEIKIWTEGDGVLNLVNDAD